MRKNLFNYIFPVILCGYLQCNTTVFAEVHSPILYSEHKYYSDIFDNSISSSATLYYKLHYLFDEINYLDTLTNEAINLFFTLFQVQDEDFQTITNNVTNYLNAQNYTNENSKTLINSNTKVYNGFNLSHILLQDIYTDIYKNNLKTIAKNFNSTQQKQLQVLIYNLKLNQLVSEQILKDFASIEYEITDRERLIIFVSFKNSIKIQKALAEHLTNNLVELAQEQNIKYIYPSKWNSEPKNISNIDLPEKTVLSIKEITAQRTDKLRNSIIKDVLSNPRKYSNKYIASVYFNVGYEYVIKKRQFEKGLEYITKAINYDPKNSSYWFNRGILNGLYLKRKNEALYDLNKAIEFNPKNAEYYYYRAYMLIITSRYGEALNDYKKVISLEPNNAEVRAYIRLLNENQGAIVKTQLMSKNIFYWSNIGGAQFEILMRNPYLLLQ